MPSSLFPFGTYRPDGVRALVPVMLAALLSAAGALGCIATYREWIDGPWRSFALTLGLGIGAAVLATLWRAAGGARPWACLAAGGVFGLWFGVLHAARLANGHAAVGVAADPAWQYARMLDPALTGDAQLRQTASDLILVAPTRSTAYVELRRSALVVPNSWPAATLPRALFDPAHAQVQEAVSWSSAVHRDGTYLTLVDADRLVVNVAAWGLLINFPAASGERTSDSVSLPQPDGALQDWTLERSGGRRRLLSAGREVWSASDAGPFQIVRIGETQRDGEHGGALHLRRIRYQRRLL